MTKRKLERFNEMKSFQNVIQPRFEDVFNKDFQLKGKWNIEYFKNNNPIILELGCGKGEYTVGLAGLFRNKNFIGIDIKGARIWKGAKTALDEKLNNVIFIRTRIETINSFFDKNEISEIWITFPDPQPEKPKKRLTSSRFLNSYKQFLRSDGFIHVKTDNEELVDHTRQLIIHNHLKLYVNCSDIYKGKVNNEAIYIQTFYEKQFIEQGLTIKYLKFQLSDEKNIEEP